MALYGFNVPNSKKPDDAGRRRRVFEIIKPYVFSKTDYKDLDGYMESIVELWLHFHRYKHSQTPRIP